MRPLSIVVAIAVELVVMPLHGGEWRVSAGYVERHGMGLTIKGTSRAQAQGAQSAYSHISMPDAKDGEPNLRLRHADPDLETYADRSFDDGFVFMDPGTANPSAIIPGQTWNWGYERPEQYDASSQTLDFHTTIETTDVQRRAEFRQGRRFTREVLNDNQVAMDDDFSGAGVGLAADYSLVSGDKTEVSLCFGINTLRNASIHGATSTYGERVKADRVKVEDRYTTTDSLSYRETYHYDTTGVNPPVAPYAGTYDGPGPVIPNQPSSYDSTGGESTRQVGHQQRTSVEQAETWTTANHIAFDTDISLYDAWLGCRIDRRLGGRLQVFARPSVSINYVDAEMDRSEIFIATAASGASRVIRNWTDSDRKGGWLLGAGMSVGANVEISHGWSFELSAGYDWVLDEMRYSVGPNEAQIDVSGFSLGVMLRKDL